MRQFWVFLLLWGVGCTPSTPIPGVVRPGPGEPFLQSLPGPMPGFGPFESYTQALMAACPLILSKPNATAGRVGSQNFQIRWRVSSEYCAWLYYTPDHKYEMTLLTDQSKPNLEDRKTCDLPPFVNDPRYPPTSLKYIFALHNHPFEDILSNKDIGYITDMGLTHGFEINTRDGNVRLAVIAFFSTSNDFESPTCDGFFEYIPATTEMVKWHHSQDDWRMEHVGLVKRLANGRYILEKN
ncbi:hypothetical protein [Hyalangium minutum]|uniref:Lipoprotein n=1 Tax=Hyalangium minutum TaxID=394096 RepID=A0A085WNA4_9BACT|nr:hypothetical protein [Hyalangium minutum]KFE69167.1 hypothetical protein DB31_7069 [Hyalangium minutum]